jgi:ABC-2 type transport system permease protein
MPILDTTDLTRRFGDLTAVDRLTLAIEPGEVFGLLGANGAGKTVPIKMLTTLLPATSGTARVAGFDIANHAADVRRVIGYVPQMISADGALTGYENLLIFAKLYDIRRAERTARITDALAFMDLEDVAGKLVRDYSGGMIRRLEIAQAMLHRPRVLFLDEPTVGLDPVARAAVWEHVERLRIEYGATIVLTTHAMPTGGLRYLDFMAPGILAQSVLFIAICYGIAIIWERDLGIVHKLLVSPTPRSALVLGKALSAGLRGLSQAVIIYVLARLLRVAINWRPLALMGVLVAVVLGSAVFSTLSLLIAVVVKTRERFMGIGQVLTMPLFFASNAVYPLDIMPRWLQIAAHLNPLTYEVDALRALMLRDGTSVYGIAMDFAVLAVALTILVMIGARAYPRVVT